MKLPYATASSPFPAGRERMKMTQPDWLDGLTHKDWLFDGQLITGDVMIERFNNLDWSGAWMDMGPSLVGNPGPYWHVPLPSEGTRHRLYPKVVKSKWLLVIRQAIKEAVENASVISTGQCFVIE